MKNLKLFLLLLLIPSFGCTRHVYSLAIVNGYCIGKNGVLLTGAQLKACCVCEGTSVPESGSGSTTASGSTASSGAATAGSGSLTGGSAASFASQGQGINTRLGGMYKTDSLRCRAIQDPPITPDVPCPSGLNEITFNLNNSAADTYRAIGSLQKNLADLIGKGSTLASNAVPPSAATAGSGSSTQDLSGLNSASIIGATGTQEGGYAGGVITSSGGAVTGPSSPISVGSPAAAVGRGGGGGGGGGSSGGSSSGSSSAASAGGSVTTDMSSAPVAGGGHYSPDTSGQTYAGGGGVGGFALGLDGGSMSPGGGTISHGDRGSAEMDLKGAKAPVSDGTVLKINDPEDYFTRIDLGQNLFGVVQKRYHEINVIWTKAP